MKHTQYDIGTKVWNAGDELTITTEPYELYGGTWQDGETASGKTVTIAVAVDGINCTVS